MISVSKVPNLCTRPAKDQIQYNSGWQNSDKRKPRTKDEGYVCMYAYMLCIFALTLCIEMKTSFSILRIFFSLYKYG